MSAFTAALMRAGADRPFDIGLHDQLQNGLGDKVTQRAVSMVLEAVYEEDFYPCSYGFRRSALLIRRLALCGRRSGPGASTG